MENKPINSEAWGYVRLHTSEKINLEDFIIVEKFVCEMHNSLLPNGIYGDGDLRKYVHKKLKENTITISYTHVDNIVNALFEFLFENNTLRPISLSIDIKKWKGWEIILQKSIRDFISSYGYVPNVLSLSTYTKSQLELVSGLRTLSKFCITEFIDKETNICFLKFCLDDSLIDKKLILKYTPRDDDDDDDFSREEFPTNTPSPTSLTESY
ncbi:hypothetical protein [Dysgonomonas capnocytophagoides]|uniref:hypothetical protein n=1 Tax=Dysgonomonas capnocytophagoides TaxID=45254 RepID=UPI00333E7DD0